MDFRSGKMLLVLASTVTLDSESRRTHYHIFPSQNSGSRTIVDFHMMKEPKTVYIGLHWEGFCHASLRVKNASACT
jgi:hypothetical protein